MEQLISRLPPGAKLLDLGAGSGSFSYASTSASVIALDLSFPPGSQACCGQVIANSEQLPFKESSLDAVLCNNTLEHFEDLEGAITEIDRILTSGGRLWVAVPDGRSLDDRLYRFLFQGGGHVNRFSLESLIRQIESRSQLRARFCKKLYSGFVYLNPPDPLKLEHYPHRARFLGRIPAPMLQIAIRWFNHSLRSVDRLVGSNLSQYGWGVLFENEESPREPTQIESLESVPSETNVCFSCGTGYGAENLRPSLRRFLIWKLYRCPGCGQKNVFVDQTSVEPVALAAESALPTQVASVTVREKLEQVARGIFGNSHPDSVQRWVQFWADSRSRAAATLETFNRLLLLDLLGKRVLDIGCGTGALGELIQDRCRLYVGGDYHFHILQFAKPGPSLQFVQCNGTTLPFTDQSFDYVFAGDVIEHLVGGRPWQVQFLNELRRVIKPQGMIFLSTPNRWYPFEGHTGLYFPQYLPLFLSNHYIGWRNPGFLKEHGSFAEIQILSPPALKRCLLESRLTFLHDLPCAMDRSDFSKRFWLRGLLARGGLGWVLHAEFWGVLVKQERREKLQLKLKKNWYYERAQPSSELPRDFQPRIDFQADLFNRQLGPGWFWHERDVRGFRWIQKEAICYLETCQPAPYLRLHGFGPRDNHLDIFVDGIRVGEHVIQEGSEFRLQYLLPFTVTADQIFAVKIRCSRTFIPDLPQDTRELGIMVFSIGLFDELEKFSREGRSDSETRTLPEIGQSG